MPPEPSTNPLAEDLEHILRHTEGLWEPLRGESVFITGGTGFFGRWLLESFAHVNRELALGARAIVLSRNPAHFRTLAPHLEEAAGIAFVQGDVKDFTATAIDAQLPSGWSRQPAFVIHAGATSGTPVAPREMFETIVDGTRRVLDFSTAHRVRKLLFVSSGAIYGRQPANLTHVPEDFCGAPDPLDASAAYSEGKRAAEFLCHLAGSEGGLETKIARCFAFVGPFLPLDTHFAIGNFIRDALRGGPIQVNGDGTPYRSYLYAADLAIWLWTILFRGKSKRAYNVGSDHDLSIAALAEEVSHEAGGVPFRIATAPNLSALPARYVPSCARARDELQLQVWTSLSASIQKTLRFAQEAPPEKLDSL